MTSESTLARVGAVIINFHRIHDCAALAKSLIEHHGLDGAMIIVVSNGESDENLSDARRIVPPEVRIEELPNPGYAAAANRGFALLGEPDFFLILTHDVELGKECIQLMLSHLVCTPRVGLVGPLVLDRREPRVVWSAGGSRTRWRRLPQHRLAGASLTEVLSCSPARVDWVEGAVLLVRGSVLQDIGGLSEAYFLYMEDVDLGSRVRARGWSVDCVRAARAWQSPGGGLSVFLSVRNLMRLLIAERSYSSIELVHPGVSGSLGGRMDEAGSPTSTIVRACPWPLAGHVRCRASGSHSATRGSELRGHFLPVLGLVGLLLLVGGRYKHLRTIMITCTVVVGFTAGALGVLVPVRIVLIPVFLGLILSSRIRPGIKPIGLLVAMLAISWQVVGITDHVTAEYVTRLVFDLPLAFLAGMGLDQSDHRVLHRAMAVAASISSVLALIETLQGRWLFSNALLTTVLTRNGSTRALAAAEHPLTLAALLTASIPAIIACSWPRTVRVLLVLLVGVGIYTTGSRGALATAALMLLVIALAQKRFRMLVRGRALATAAAAAAVVALSYLILTAGPLGSETSSDSVRASAEYRPILYKAAGNSLVHHPFGHGLGGPPHGIYLVPSPFGVLDVADTVDSEYALLAFTLGYVGLAIALFMVWRVISRGGLVNATNQSALSILICGTFLALDSWIGLGSLLAVLLGASRPNATTEGERDEKDRTESTRPSAALHPRIRL